MKLASHLKKLDDWTELRDISAVELSDGWLVNRFSAHVTFVKGLDALLTPTVPTQEGHVSLPLHTDWAKHLVLNLLGVRQCMTTKMIFLLEPAFLLPRLGVFPVLLP